MKQDKETRERTAVLLSVSKNIDVGMQSEIYESVVQTSFDGHGFMRNRTFPCSFSQRVLQTVWVKFSLLPQSVHLL